MSIVTIDAPTGTGVGGRLRAYSSFEPYELISYLDAMRHDLPDIAIEILRLPTAALTQKLLDAADDLEADLILGWADTAARTPGLESIVTADSDSSDGWCRPTGFSTAFVVDEKGVQLDYLEKVQGWTDLADPRLAGRISFPDPRVSGAGYLALTTLLQRFGETEGWSLMAAINRNVAAYASSAWEPAQLTGNGNIAIGVTVRIAVAKRISEVPWLRACDPADGVGTEAEVYGILAGTRQRPAAQRVLDWICSARARPLFSAYAKINMAAPEPGLFAIDAHRAVAERAAVLQKFTSLMDRTRAVVGTGSRSSLIPKSSLTVKAARR
jgi:iron(III) transport system substrate-binding protein